MDEEMLVYQPSNVGTRKETSINTTRGGRDEEGQITYQPFEMYCNRAFVLALVQRGIQRNR